MKIYFAASIRGGRDDTALYRDIISCLKKKAEVLTEHIGNNGLTSFGDQGALTDIYARDMEWLKSADAVVAEVSTPSLGVGYEIAKAEDMGKKVLCLYRPSPERGLSAMIGGSKNIVVKEY